MDSQVRRVVVDIVTSYASAAGTKAQVFLGLGGREFRLSVDSRTDFERGAELSYQLGEDSNVQNPERNDPRLGKPLSRGDILEHPVYLRIAPKNDRDDWNIETVAVRVFCHEERRAIRYSALDGPHETAWLGFQSGLMLHLRRHSLDRLTSLESEER